MEILIQEEIAIVQSICEIINYHKSIGERPDTPLPTSIQPIVIDDCPIHSRAMAPRISCRLHRCRVRLPECVSRRDRLVRKVAGAMISYCI